MNLRRVEKRDGLVFMMFLKQYGQRRLPCQYKTPGRLQEHQPADRIQADHFYADGVCAVIRSFMVLLGRGASIRDLFMNSF